MSDVANENLNSDEELIIAEETNVAVAEVEENEINSVNNSEEKLLKDR